MSADNQMHEARSKSSRLRLIFNILIFGLMPLLLVMGVLVSGVRLVEESIEQSSIRSELDERQPAYVETATALAPTIHADEGAYHGTEHEVASVRRRSASDPMSQVFATNTPIAEEAPPTATEPLATVAVPVLPTLLFPPEPGADTVSVTAIPTRFPTIPRDYDLVNIVLLGGDDEVTGENIFRTDTMIVVSVNLDTRTVSMLSLPRDLFVYIPSGTMQRLNVAYGLGESIGWTDGGWGLLRQTIFYNFGINVHYYARVDFSGFEEIIDTLGGVDIAVDCAYQDYYPVDDFDPSRPIEENYELRTLPVGYYTLDGFDALWYARTRKVSDDFDRGRRQQQILRAIYRKALATGDLANLPTLWGQLTEVVETNMQLQDVVNLLPIALNLDPSRIDNFTMIRTYHTTPWQTPTGDYVQLPNYDPINQLLNDFYQPPSSSQLELSGPTVIVYNGTGNEDWDRIAAERLIWEGFNAVAGGPADQTDHAATTLIDYTGETKGSLVGVVADVLNIPNDQISVSPDPNRSADYEIVLGSNYNSCTFGVLPVEDE